MQSFWISNLLVHHVTSRLEKFNLYTVFDGVLEVVVLSRQIKSTSVDIFQLTPRYTNHRAVFRDRHYFKSHGKTKIGTLE